MSEKQRKTNLKNVMRNGYIELSRNNFDVSVKVSKYGGFCLTNNSEAKKINFGSSGHRKVKQKISLAKVNLREENSDD